MRITTRTPLSAGDNLTNEHTTIPPYHANQAPDIHVPDAAHTGIPQIFTIGTSSGIAAQITNYGARVMRVTVPDRHGKPTNVLLGMPTITDYAHDNVCLGAIIGRNANRIANARYIIAGATYQLTANDGPNNSHSGPHGFEHRCWTVTEADSTHVVLTLDSPDGDQGFPGHMQVRAQYTALGSTLRLDISATCDRTTIANMTSHAYWNLAGEGNGNMLDHTLMIPTGRFCPADNTFIPLPPAEVYDTAMDFRRPRTIGAALQFGRDHHDPQIINARGYNHAFVFEDAHGLVDGASPADRETGMRTVAVAASERTGITMTQRANSPAILLYSAGFLDGIVGTSGHIYHPYAGFALEPGFVPNSINDDSQISSELPADQHYHLCIAWQFGVSD